MRKVKRNGKGRLCRTAVGVGTYFRGIFGIALTPKKPHVRPRGKKKKRKKNPKEKAVFVVSGQ